MIELKVFLEIMITELRKFEKWLILLIFLIRNKTFNILLVQSLSNDEEISHKVISFKLKEILIHEQWQEFYLKESLLIFELIINLIVVDEIEKLSNFKNQKRKSILDLENKQKSKRFKRRKNNKALKNLNFKTQCLTPLAQQIVKLKSQWMSVLNL